MIDFSILITSFSLNTLDESYLVRAGYSHGPLTGDTKRKPDQYDAQLDQWVG